MNLFNMKIFCETDQHVEVPYDSLKGVSLENLNLHRAQLENIDLFGTSCLNTKSRLIPAFSIFGNKISR
ncbi:hypothetical protein DBR32_12625 [Taibaiella sp. KBW10]|nr:hypothetical protein DBR32_12625 [Taibaiella sp. KBW10]